MITPDPSVPLMVFIGMICIIVLILIIDELKKIKNKN